MEVISVEELNAKTHSTFVFYSRSSKKAPGKGNKECAKHRFVKLEKIPDFRQRLSNFYPCRIETEDGRVFSSVEHFFHAEKTAMVDPKRAIWFEKGEVYDRLQPREVGLMTNKKHLNLGDKSEEWEKSVPFVLERMWRLKFTQNKALKKMLLATEDARLVHYAKRRNGPAVYEHWTRLEALREELNKDGMEE